ncbi:MAG: 4Fe-4S binding protein, partial [Deltaproteobacteria bacterium]|nr:4Fe-4S binding protein [Deltaproteobacteria bacterium]
MAMATNQVAGVGGLDPQTARLKSRVDRQARKALAARARKVRRLKQSLLGTGFVLLLGAGWLYPLIGYFIPACMVLGIGLAAFRGRSWCDWLCPRGSFEDALVARISRRRRIPEVLRRPPLRVAVMTLLMGLLTFQIIRLLPDPWAIGGAFILLLTITTTVGVVLGVLYQQRAWCYICPIGTMSNWVGKNRRPLTLAAELCRECSLCAKNCPMQLSPAELKDQAAMTHHGDC